MCAQPRVLSFILAALGLVSLGSAAPAAKPTPAEALKLVPVQREIDYDVPAAKEIEICIVDVETVGGITGWVVKTPGGQILRRFLDTNGDNRVDQWCYFKDGIEIYRDIDVNFNNKADQYRWLGIAGTRWGLDDDENGRIDSWKVISPEEVTAEVVAAFRDRDTARFQRLLLTADDLKSLGLNQKHVTDLTEKVATATRTFAGVADKQRVVTPQSEWIHFGASKPGVIPAGTDGSTKDIVVYDNVTAVVETAGAAAAGAAKQHGQLIVGTLVKVGDAWKLFDLPKNLTGNQTAAAGGYFFLLGAGARAETDVPSAAGGVSPEMQKLTGDLEQLDKRLASATTPAEQARLNATRADLLDKIIAAAPADQRGLWVRQYTETVSAAVQSGAYPDGVGRLQSLLTKVTNLPDGAELIPYVKQRLLTAEYNRDIAVKDADFEKVNTRYIEQLEQFVKEYGTSPDAAEAMLQLAIDAEFTKQREKAIAWFGRIATDFPKSELAEKAAGAKFRLVSVGKSLGLKGKTLDGRNFDTATANGKLVLIHYWTTTCGPCKDDMELIKSLLAKYGGQGFYPVGINLDNDVKDASNFLKSKPLSWPQLYETGGLDSRLATQYGILSLPTMILIGKDGRVIDANIQSGELEAEVKKQLR
ncbi:MAG TPA: redoxin family protein [Pirellulaceae bacterium]|nr:redoxin family protein [Pirellulaceae bacterium]